MSLPEVTGRGGTSPFDAIRQTRPDGTEFWSARDLCQVVEYETWRNFAAAIDRAKLSLQNSGEPVTSHVVGADKLVQRPQGGTVRQEDFELSRLGAYLVVMNGDPRKSSIAEAQSYFAIQTRIAETTPAAPAIPRNYAAALRAAADEAERADAAERMVAELAPKAAYVDDFVANDDLLSVRTVASTVGMQEGQLRDLLISKKWIYRETTTRWSDTQGRKIPVNRYSEYADKKPYFRRVEQHDVPRFRGEVMHSLKITPPGAAAIARLVQRTGGNVIDLFDGGDDA
ncbi:phage antirepressor KilAC domain-containing protein [Rhodococcus pyridinivorans]|uniref:phage antirepressor KilAC domain-containing protein n=1 Tax=Rhodococcus pyridinivorans TaxID=103816 RepID=UPI001E6194FE|nr:phage antirepressor KilAC domain-containing protein [Rhodococcus pyridinivorans]MCD5419752.1 phage antirepressor KilAC domain-containing protein [Rhodococcus pyridinivorans]